MGVPRAYMELVRVVSVVVLSAALAGCMGSGERAADRDAQVRETAERCRAVMNPQPVVTWAEWNSAVAAQREKSLPILIDRFGPERGKVEFERRVGLLRDAVQPGVAPEPDPFEVEVCRQWIAAQLAPSPPRVVVPVPSGPLYYERERQRRLDAQAEMNAWAQAENQRLEMQGIRRELQEQNRLEMQRQLQASTAPAPRPIPGVNCSHFHRGFPC